jgi:dipeptidyl aminopeptidase/acylaminoacyl peptidase
MAENIGELFVDNGYVVLAVDYRSGPLGLQDVEDTLSAIDYLNQADYVDGERIGVYGASHGGYVALMCAWRSNVQAVVEAAGFCDLGDMVTRLVSTGRLGDEMIQFYGGYPDELPEVYREYSPCGHISEVVAPILIIHGKSDSVVPVDHAYTLSALLEEYNNPYEMYISETGEHGFYHRTSEEAQIVWELVFAFFEKYLKQEQV